MWRTVFFGYGRGRHLDRFCAEYSLGIRSEELRESCFGVSKLVSQKVSIIGKVFGFPAADETVVNISWLKSFGIEGKCNRLPWSYQFVCFGA